MYIKAKIIIAGEQVRAVKKIREGKTQAVLYQEGGQAVVMTRQGKRKYDNINQANMFLRRF